LLLFCLISPGCLDPPGHPSSPSQPSPRPQLRASVKKTTRTLPIHRQASGSPRPPVCQSAPDVVLAGARQKVPEAPRRRPRKRERKRKREEPRAPTRPNPNSPKPDLKRKQQTKETESKCNRKTRQVVRSQSARFPPGSGWLLKTRPPAFIHPSAHPVIIVSSSSAHASAVQAPGDATACPSRLQLGAQAGCDCGRDRGRNANRCRCTCRFQAQDADRKMQTAYAMHAEVKSTSNEMSVGAVPPPSPSSFLNALPWMYFP
jgi:hypothetical protein